MLLASFRPEPVLIAFVLPFLPHSQERDRLRRDNRRLEAAVNQLRASTMQNTVSVYPFSWP